MPMISGTNSGHLPTLLFCKMYQKWRASREFPVGATTCASAL